MAPMHPAWPGMGIQRQKDKVSAVKEWAVQEREEEGYMSLSPPISRVQQRTAVTLEIQAAKQIKITF